MAGSQSSRHGFRGNAQQVLNLGLRLRKTNPCGIPHLAHYSMDARAVPDRARPSHAPSVLNPGACVLAIGLSQCRSARGAGRIAVKAVPACYRAVSTRKDHAQWDDLSRCLPANGPICRWTTWPAKRRNLATTAWNWPAGATTSKSTRPWPTTTTAHEAGTAGKPRPASATPSATTWSARPCWTSSTSGTRRSCPPYVWGDGDPAGVNERAAEEMKNTARAAQKLGVERGQRLHRFEHLAPALLVPARVARDDRRGLRTAGRAVEPDPRRVRRMRRQVRPGGPPDGNRLRHVHGRAGAGGAGPPRGVRLQLRPQPPASGRASIRSSSFAASPTGSTTST